MRKLFCHFPCISKCILYCLDPAGTSAGHFQRGLRGSLRDFVPKQAALTFCCLIALLNSSPWCSRCSMRSRASLSSAFSSRPLCRCHPPAWPPVTGTSEPTLCSAQAHGRDKVSFPSSSHLPAMPLPLGDSQDTCVRLT